MVKFIKTVKYLNFNFQILYINLKESKERNKLLKNSLSKLKFPKHKIRRIEGIRIKNLSNKTKFKNLNKGEIGCFKAHINCLKKAAKSKIPSLILEDDALITKKNIKFITDFLQLNNSNNYLLFLSSWRPNMTKRYYKNNKFLQNMYLKMNAKKVMSINKNSIYHIKNNNIINFISPMWFISGATGYLISPNCAKKLLKLINNEKEINLNFDVYTSSQSKKINILIPDRNIIKDRKVKSVVGNSKRNLGNMCNKLGICIKF